MQQNTAPANNSSTTECTCQLGQDHTCGLPGRHLINLNNAPSAMEERFRAGSGYVPAFSRRW